MKETVCSALILAALVMGQGTATVTPTKVGLHHIGESVQEWNNITHSFDAIDKGCKSKLHGILGKLDKENCQHLKDVRDGKQNEIGTKESGRVFTWHFDGGKLSAVKIDVPDPSAPLMERQAVNTRQEIAMLTEVYGQPTKSETVPYRDIMGAKWECSRVYWSMPDGTEISAEETIDSYDDFRRVLTIVLATKEAIQKFQTPPPKNPYKPQ